MLQPILRVVLLLLIAIIPNLQKRSQRIVAKDSEIYRLHPFYSGLCIFAGLFFLSTPLWIETANKADMLASPGFYGIMLFAGLSFIAAIALFRYRIILRDSEFDFIIFRKRTIKYSDVINVSFIYERNAMTEAILDLRGGEELSISGMIGDSEDAFLKLKSRRCGTENWSKISAEKRAAQPRPLFGLSQKNRYLLIGIVVVFIILLILIPLANWHSRGPLVTWH